MKLVSRNYKWLAITGASIVIFTILLSVSLDYARITHNTCFAPYCSLINHIPVQSYIGFSILIASAILGSYLTFVQPKNEISQTLSKAKINKLIANLQDEEKKIFDRIVKDGGSIFQTDLTGATNFSKVKVSRILDRLETKGLVERRRRGMSNIIILKY